MQYKNVKVIGTSHIARESVKEVEKIILEEKPDIVALELDKNRLRALLEKKKGAKISFMDIRKIGVKGFLFALIGAWIEKKLGEKVGVSPGAEMISAFKAARKIESQVALIDQDIEVTLKRFSQELSWKEKWNFVVDLVQGMFGKGVIKFDITKVPDVALIQKLLKEVKDRYPNVYKTLVQERNVYMAKKLASLAQLYEDKKILAVVGAGHEEDMILLVKKYINSA